MKFIEWNKRRFNEWLEIFGLLLNAIKNDRHHKWFYYFFLSLIGLSIFLDWFNLEEYDYFGLIGITGLLLYTGNLLRIIIPNRSTAWIYRLYSYGIFVMGIFSFIVLLLSFLPFFYLLPWRIWGFFSNK